MNNKKNINIVIIGGGILGSTIALALAQKGWNILIIEKNKFKNLKIQNEPYLRVSALNYQSIQFFKKINIWHEILKINRYQSYKTIKILENKKTILNFQSKNIQIPVMGYIIENNILQKILLKNLIKKQNVSLKYSNKSINLNYKKKKWEIIINNKKIFTDFIIGADGKFSELSNIIGIRNYGFQYEQSCLLIIIKINQIIKKDIVWQEFTSTGPRAFLPLFDAYACLIWYEHPKKIKDLKNMTNKKLKEKIRKKFKNELNNIKIIKKDSFPLFFYHASHYIKNGIALIGDAAHTIHPLAGQGINLGLRDINTLVNTLNYIKKNSLSINNKKNFYLYEKKRKQDFLLMQSSITIIDFLFKSNFQLVSNIKEVLFNFLNKSNLLKNQILKYALGLYF
ncbi:MAG: FAD-dependent oxidoreductase [Arsenophonus sp.]|nr:MAG: FAD-dependent oxidoreductase [Arsenophonus sp.]